jgi:hypothetical protein
MKRSRVKKTTSRGGLAIIIATRLYYLSKRGFFFEEFDLRLFQIFRFFLVTLSEKWRLFLINVRVYKYIFSEIEVM